MLNEMPELVAAGFKPEEIAELQGDIKGKAVVLKPNRVLKKYRKKEFLVWHPYGGFGCSESAIGKAVFATCDGDGEDSNWRRNDFCALYVGEAVAKTGGSQ